MAGNINGTSVIWVAGETSGKTQSGAVVSLSSALPDSNQDLVDYVDTVASGIVAGTVDLAGYATEAYADAVVSGYATTGYADGVVTGYATEFYTDSAVASGVVLSEDYTDVLHDRLVASGILES